LGEPIYAKQCLVVVRSERLIPLLITKRQAPDALALGANKEVRLFKGPQTRPAGHRLPEPVSARHCPLVPNTNTRHKKQFVNFYNTRPAVTG
jgi:hypothetical protein